MIAVFALIAGLVAADFDALPEAFRHRSPEDMARHAFSVARARALESHAPVVLRVEDNLWRLFDARGEPLETFETTAKDDPRRLVPIPANDEKPADATAIPQLRFTADGTTGPVRVRLADKSATRLRVWRVDPYSSILTREPSE